MTTILLTDIYVCTYTHVLVHVYGYEIISLYMYMYHNGLGCNVHVYVCIPPTTTTGSFFQFSVQLHQLIFSISTPDTHLPMPGRLHCMCANSMLHVLRNIGLFLIIQNNLEFNSPPVSELKASFIRDEPEVPISSIRDIPSNHTQAEEAPFVPRVSMHSTVVY